MNKIPRNKWLEIYASLKLIQFYGYIQTSKPNLLSSARFNFNEFNKKNYNDNDINSFDCVPNGLSFIYLLLVRSSEILDRFLKEEYIDVKKDVWEDIKLKLRSNNFDEYINLYGLKIIENKIPENWIEEEDFMKIFHLMSNIRNSISHWRYDINPENNIITLKDRKNKTSEDNFHIEIEYHQLLNLTQHLISLIHDHLKFKNRIE